MPFWVLIDSVDLIESVTNVLQPNLTDENIAEFIGAEIIGTNDYLIGLSTSAINSSLVPFIDFLNQEILTLEYKQQQTE